MEPGPARSLTQLELLLGAVLLLLYNRVQRLSGVFCKPFSFSLRNNLLADVKHIKHIGLSSHESLRVTPSDPGELTPLLIVHTRYQLGVPP